MRAEDRAAMVVSRHTGETVLRFVTPRNKLLMSVIQAISHAEREEREECYKLAYAYYASERGDLLGDSEVRKAAKYIAAIIRARGGKDE